MVNQKAKVDEADEEIVVDIDLQRITTYKQ